jgi:beta-glucosidase
LEARVDSILKTLSIEEKIGQLNLRGTSSRSKELSQELIEQVRKGEVGAVLNLTNPQQVMALQEIAMKESRSKIPLMFGRDVIHGYKTMFPIPLALAASWDMELVETTSAIAAHEAYSQGIHWTFAPMLDICRDARWGRIAESPGEDPYLASKLAVAYIRGFQGSSPGKPGSLIACAKHFAAYGAAEGGRDYNTAQVSLPVLHDVYLKPFEAAVEAGAGTFMAGFQDLNGVPCTANRYLIQDILKTKWKYSGFLVSDWNANKELIAHGYADDEKDAAYKAMSAGLDMEMTSKTYERFLKQLIQEKFLKEEQLNEAVRNIIRTKLKFGLFENPYFKDRNLFPVLSQEHLSQAKDAAIKSAVLLHNQASTLPLSQKTSIALLGPLADAAREQLGTWTFDGNPNDAITPKKAWEQKGIPFQYAAGLPYSRSKDESYFKAAISAAKKSEVIIFVGGEEAILSGEAHSRADIRLPGNQEKLILELAKTKKKIILVLMAGRPLDIQAVLPHVHAVLMMWHPGTMGGPALFDLIYGTSYPSGKLPVTWPKSGAQLPLYYNHTNTGRPASASSFIPLDSIPVGAWQSSLGNTSHYLDLGYAPQFPFGHGLGYTEFSFSQLHLKQSIYQSDDTLRVSLLVKNTGKSMGKETVQLYLQDVTGSVVRPIKELKAFEQITLAPGMEKEVYFAIPIASLGFHDSQLNFRTEPGKFKVMAGNSSATLLTEEFILEP